MKLPKMIIPGISERCAARVRMRARKSNARPEAVIWKGKSLTLHNSLVSQIATEEWLKRLTMAFPLATASERS